MIDCWAACHAFYSTYQIFVGLTDNCSGLVYWYWYRLWSLDTYSHDFHSPRQLINPRQLLKSCVHHPLHNSVLSRMALRTKTDEFGDISPRAPLVTNVRRRSSCARATVFAILRDIYLRVDVLFCISCSTVVFCLLFSDYVTI